MFQLQGDAGSAAIFFCMFLAMSFGAGVQLRYFVGLFAAIGAAFPLVWKYLLDDYQKDRFTIFLHPESDPTGKGLQQLQGKISIGSGQLWGRGLFSPLASKRAACRFNKATTSFLSQANSSVLSAACWLFCFFSFYWCALFILHVMQQNRSEVAFVLAFSGWLLPKWLLILACVSICFLWWVSPFPFSVPVVLLPLVSILVLDSYSVLPCTRSIWILSKYTCDPFHQLCSITYIKTEPWPAFEQVP